MSLISDSLKGRVCIVTGAAKSIGFAIAEKFASNGAEVILLDIDPAVEASANKLTDKGYTANGYILDITDRDAVFACFKKITEHFGNIYALVNNVGAVDQRPFEECTPEIFDRVFRVNVYGTSYCIQAALPSMKSQKDGKIINFASKSGKTGSALMAPYSAAKGAVIVLTQALAHEFAKDNIKINAICPGITPGTGMWDRVSAEYVENLKLSQDEITKKFTEKIPLGRFTEIKDIVEFVFFLTVSGEYFTGQAFNVSGGREMH